jgi:Tol biopolymer transport system component
MHDVRHKKTLRGLRETLRISAKSNMGDEEDVSELARLEERHGSHLAAEKMRKGILAMLVVSATVLAGIGLNQIFRVGSKTNSFTTAAAGNGRIAYVSQSEDGSELWVVNADGSDPVRLVGPIGKLPASLSDPFWSSDGTKLGYNAHGIGSVGIETINADGAGRAVITPESLEYADSPDWSPDGQRIAFSYSDGRRGSSIFVMNPDGTNVSRLTGDDLSAQKPSWSPDGTKIAFVVEDLSDSDALNNWDVYVMNGDGSGVTRLTEDPHLDLDPDWSPDGTEIVFRSRRDSVGVAPGAELGSPPDEIYVMNADGTEPRRLTVDEAVDQHPVWSPDGTMIAFHSLRDGPDGIYVMNADGSGIRRVASGAMLAWQPVHLETLASPRPPHVLKAPRATVPENPVSSPKPRSPRARVGVLIETRSDGPWPTRAVGASRLSMRRRLPPFEEPWCQTSTSNSTIQTSEKATTQPSGTCGGSLLMPWSFRSNTLCVWRPPRRHPTAPSRYHSTAPNGYKINRPMGRPSPVCTCRWS